MGMTIDEIIQGIEVIKAQAEWDYPLDWQILLDDTKEIICKYQIMQAEYEARLKADMVAMLTDIQISVAELDFSWMCDYADGDCIKRYAVVDIIQEKINALKGDQAAG